MMRSFATRVRSAVRRLIGVVHAILLRLWGVSIWHPDAIPEADGARAAEAELKRYVLPIFDAFIALMGVAGIIRGLPSFTEVYDVGVSFFAGCVLLLGSLSALIGISFPKLWRAEAAGKLLMLLVIGGYATALWVLTFQGVGERWIVAIAFTALLGLPVWTMRRLGRERRHRQAGEERS